MDGSGPNAAWERESLSRLSQEVIPLLRKQIALDEVAQRRALTVCGSR